MNSKEKYLSLTGLHLKLPLFFRPWWLDMASQHWDIAMAENKDGFLGIFPYCIEKKLGIQIIRNPSLTPYLGPLILKGNDVAVSNNNSIIEKLWQQIPQQGSFDVETTTNFNDIAFFKQQGCNVQEKITYELSLQADEDTLYQGFHYNHRKLIRLASSVHTIEEGIQHLPILLPLHERTYTRKGKKYFYDAVYISKIITTCIDKNAGQLFSAKDEHDQITACLFTVWDNEKMYLLLSALNAEIAHHGAARLLIWHAIQLAKKKGLAIFDFEGSMDERVGNIYKRFGGDRKTYLCISKNNSFLWKIKKQFWG